MRDVVMERRCKCGIAASGERGSMGQTDLPQPSRAPEAQHFNGNNNNDITPSAFKARVSGQRQSYRRIPDG